MNEDEFWELIADTKRRAERSTDGQEVLLREALKQYTADEILQFDAIYFQKRNDAYTADLWDVADFVTCGGGEQPFLDFRAWLISQGKEVYEKALDDPDTLSEVLESTSREEEDARFEEFSYAALEAYEEKTGGQNPYIGKGPFDSPRLKGERKGLETIPDRFPKLYKKLGDCPEY
jgi:hypothetical protein